MDELHSPRKFPKKCNIVIQKAIGNGFPIGLDYDELNPHGSCNLSSLDRAMAGMLSSSSYSSEESSFITSLQQEIITSLVHDLWDVISFSLQEKFSGGFAVFVSWKGDSLILFVLFCWLSSSSNVFPVVVLAQVVREFVLSIKLFLIVL